MQTRFVNVDTRLRATREAASHDDVKALLTNEEGGTNLIGRKFHNSAWVARTSVSDRVVAMCMREAAAFPDVRPLVSGAKGRAELRDDPRVAA